MKEHETYDWYYDEDADFLEVSFEEPAESGTTEEVQEGVFVTRDADTNRVSNVGIFSFNMGDHQHNKYRHGQCHDKASRLRTLVRQP